MRKEEGKRERGRWLGGLEPGSKYFLILVLSAFFLSFFFFLVLLMDGFSTRLLLFVAGTSWKMDL